MSCVHSKGLCGKMSFGRVHAAREFAFHELQQAMSNFLGPFRCYVDRACILDSCGYESFIATLCVGVIAVMRETRSNLFGMMEALVVEIKKPVSRKAVVNAERGSVGMWSWLSGLLGFGTGALPSRRQLLQEIYGRIPAYVDQVLACGGDDYETLQRITEKLFNDGVRSSSIYHEHYINYLALIVAAYRHFLSRDRMIAVLGILVRFDATSGVTFYDDYDSDAVIVIEGD